MSVAAPETAYARSGDVHIAYQAFGEGELDLVMVPGFVTHVELIWEAEPSARFLDALGSFARVINFDRRGSGLSDPVVDAPTLEERMDDVRAVMDAAGSERAVLMGISEGVPMSLLFAATYPERVEALVCYGGMARSTWAEDYDFATPADALTEAGFDLILPYWGQGAAIEVSSPSQADDPEARAFAARMERASASPGMLAALARMFIEIDVRDVVPTVQAPTLVAHRRHDRLVNVRHGRWIAEHLPNAKLVELPGGDHLPWGEGADALIDEIKAFLTGTHYAPEPDRVLATVLFTDIVDSTGSAARLGDQRWRELLEGHRKGVRGALARHGGREVKTLGDGFLVSFDGPARGIRCAREIVASSGKLGLQVRAGLHTGECEVMGDDLGGIAIHIAARVSALAEPSEVLVSRTVKDLVAGSGIEFTDRGVHELRGVPDRWDLHAVES
jgi:pimeloyl-ACP methyl ester carboxylesterase